MTAVGDEVWSWESAEEVWIRNSSLTVGDSSSPQEFGIVNVIRSVIK
jgi:hypothetical protein